MIYLNNEDGLTLVEAIIALVVMLVLVTAFAGAMTVGLQSEIEVEKRLQVSDIASSIVEYLGREGELSNYIGIQYFEDDNFNIKEILGSSYDELYFEGIDESGSKVEIKDLDFATDLFEVIVTINWYDRGNLMNYNLSTFIYSEGDGSE